MAHVRQLTPGAVEDPAWRRWMREIGKYRERYYRRAEHDPIAMGETATVGLMLSAAGSAGLLGMLEYPTEKKSEKKKGWAYGRCDLWLLAPRHRDRLGWAFEVKQRRITKRSPAKLLVAPFRAAWRDAGMLDVSEASMRIACTVFYSDYAIDDQEESLMTLRKLARVADWSWRISHDNDLPPVYVLLKRRRRGNRLTP